MSYLFTLASYTYIHAYVCVYIHIYVTFPLSMHLYWSCFHILAIEVMLHWTWKCRYLFEILISFSLGMYPVVGLMDHMIVLLIFWGTSLLFSVVAAPIYILINSVPGFPFLDNLVNTCYLTFLKIDILTGDISLGFDLHFPDDKCSWTPFYILVDLS